MNLVWRLNKYCVLIVIKLCKDVIGCRNIFFNWIKNYNFVIFLNIGFFFFCEIERNENIWNNCCLWFVFNYIWCNKKNYKSVDEDIKDIFY